MHAPDPLAEQHQRHPTAAGPGVWRGTVWPTGKVTRGSLPHVDKYFEQAFGVAHPPAYDLAALRSECERARPVHEDVYIECGGMAAGLTSIVSQVKVCLKMAIETGSNIVLPAMPLRDSTNLKEFNFLNGDAYLTYDKWFDADHLKESLTRACPKMKVIHPDEVKKKTVEVKNKFNIGCGDAEGYKQFNSYFWVGRPYKNYFAEKYLKLQAEADAKPNSAAKTGINIVTVDSNFLLFRITDDPSGRDLRLWNDLDRVIRYREKPREVVEQVMQKLPRPYYGVHFRVENDSMWSSLEHQLEVDLDGLDMAWDLQGRPEPKPAVYLACGDQGQMEKFIAAGAKRGWEVTHKWKVLENDPETVKKINSLAFDFMGAIDLGVMVKSDFFFGISGSAFSVSVANLRDPTGRYRGSSFDILDDVGARTHLFWDLDPREYPCCL